MQLFYPCFFCKKCFFVRNLTICIFCENDNRVQLDMQLISISYQIIIESELRTHKTINRDTYDIKMRSREIEGKFDE